MIRVSYHAVPNDWPWLAVCVPLAHQRKLFCVGFTRYSVACSVWVARTRYHRVSGRLLVQSFGDQSAAATWLLLVGKYAQPSHRMREAAA